MSLLRRSILPICVKSDHSFTKYHVHKFYNRRTNTTKGRIRPVENITPRASLTCRKPNKFGTFFWSMVHSIDDCWTVEPCFQCRQSADRCSRLCVCVSVCLCVKLYACVESLSDVLLCEIVRWVATDGNCDHSASQSLGSTHPAVPECEATCTCADFTNSCINRNSCMYLSAIARGHQLSTQLYLKDTTEKNKKNEKQQVAREVWTYLCWPPTYDCN